ncbi:MAG: universal stress protein [Syntrophobacteraceae bacterium]
MTVKMLVSIDLSENSLRAVDYVGEMLACHSDAEITLLHVIKEPSSDIVLDDAERHEQVERLRVEMLALMEEAAKRLTSRGIVEKRVCLKIQACKSPVSVAELILAEQELGGYGTIVVGRRGMSKKEEFLFGSVSSKVVREARHCAVWVVE